MLLLQRFPYNFKVRTTISILKPVESFLNWRFDDLTAIREGKDASIKDFPYHVYLEESGNTFVCQGAIIDENWVVTVDEYCAKKDRVRAGSDSRGQGGSVHRVDKVVHHPAQNIALMHVKKPFKFDETRQPIKIYDEPEKLVPYAMVNVTGFDWLGEENHSDSMQSVQLPILESSACEHKSESDWLYFALDPEIKLLGEGLKCMGYVQKDRKGVGWEDWGVPVAVDGYLAGVASNVPRRGLIVPHPTVFVSLGAYRDWIYEQLTIEVQ